MKALVPVLLPLICASTAWAQPGGTSDKVKDIGFASAYSQIAMMPLTSLGSTEEATQSVERILISEFTKLLGERIIPPGRLSEYGEEATQAFEECQGAASCLVEAVGSLGWDAFIVGNIAGLGEDRVINLRLYDIRTGGEIRRASQEISGDEKQLITQMRAAAVTLMAPELLLGTLVLKVPQGNVEIFVDGRKIGTTPLTNPEVEVSVGRHAVEAKGAGLVPFSSFVDVAYEERATVDILLPKNTIFVGGSTPFRARWWTWTIAGAGLASVALGAYFNVQQGNDVAEIERRFNDGTLTADQRSLFNQEKDNWRNAVIFYSVGGAMLGTVGVLLGLDLITPSQRTESPTDGATTEEPGPSVFIGPTGVGARF